VFASIGRHVACGLKAGANIQPEPPAFVLSVTPVLLFGGAGETVKNQVELSWHGGGLRLLVTYSEGNIGETVWLLQGSRLITDCAKPVPKQ
jgi:hypothetical protein